MDTKSIRQLERPSLRDQVYEQLKRAIVTLELKPGERIKDSDLASKFGVSRTPVREALKRLEDEGLVESTPGSNTKITELDEEEAQHAFIVIATLHSLATRLAVPLLDDKDIELMQERNADFEEAIASKDVIRAVEADDSFHNVLLTASGNKEIFIALERVVPKVRRLEFAKFSSLDRFTSVAEHEQIIGACQTGQAQRASELVERNWLGLGKLLGANVQDI